MVWNPYVRSTTVETRQCSNTSSPTSWRTWKRKDGAHTRRYHQVQNYFYFFFFFFFFYWHNSPLWALACRTMSFHFFFNLLPTLSIFSLPALEDLFLLPLSTFSRVFPFFSSLPVLEWRSFWASYPPPFSLGDLTSVSFALLSILLYFLLCSSLLVLDSSDFSILRFRI